MYHYRIFLLGTLLILSHLSCTGFGDEQSPQEVAASYEIVGPDQVLLGQPAAFSVLSPTALDEELSFVFTAREGSITEDQPYAITYTAPRQGEDDTLTLTISDDVSVLRRVEKHIRLDDPLFFSSPQNISETPGNSKSPFCATSPDGGLFVIWHDFSHDPAAIYFAQKNTDVWQTEILSLHEDKSYAPRLLASGNTLHAFFSAGTGIENPLFHAQYQNEEWSSAVEFGYGKKPVPALDPHGGLHVFFFVGNQLNHVTHSPEGWIEESPAPISHPYIVTLRHAALISQDGIDLFIASSPGEEGYDIRRLRWMMDGQYEEMETVYQSLHLSSDDMDAAMDSKGDRFLVWTEQDPESLWDFRIALWDFRLETFQWVSDDPGMTMHPVMVIPPDDLPLIAWVSPEEDIYISQSPFADTRKLQVSQAAGPSLCVDGMGSTHLFYFAPDENGIQQIFYTTNRISDDEDPS